MVDSSSFLSCLVLLVAIRNPSCLSYLPACAKEGNKEKRRWGASIAREMSDRGNRDFVKKSKFETIKLRADSVLANAVHRVAHRLEVVQDLLEKPRSLLLSGCLRKQLRRG